MKFFKDAFHVVKPKKNNNQNTNTNSQKVHGLWCRTKNLLHRNNVFVANVGREHGQLAGLFTAMTISPTLITVGTEINTVETAIDKARACIQNHR